MKVKISLFIVFVLCLIYCNLCKGGNVRQQLFKNGACFNSEFRCSNDKCISSSKYCDGRNDCGDNSDERSCGSSADCPTHYKVFKCKNYNDYYERCIPFVWRCDGIKHCPRGDDEKDCDLTINMAKHLAIKWILNRAKSEMGSLKWDQHIPRIAVALFLHDPAILAPRNRSGMEIAYELRIQLLSRLAMKDVKEVSTSELALYLNAFLVSCIDPRKFHVLDLVAELRSRVDLQNHTNPYAMLALCNAGEKITDRDVEKLINTFWASRTDFWTDTQALVVMALSCAASQPYNSFDIEDIKEFTLQLKQKQFRNGTVDNLKTTALVMQALFSAEREDDEDNFDEEKAVQQILQSQLEDGSFGNIVNTYYVLPVLNYRSLVNISSDHCGVIIKDEETGLKDLINQVGEKWKIQFSLWIGDNVEVERTLKLRVPANTSFYGIMEWAADVDKKYRFKYSIKNRKPYVYELSGIQDDPESGQFWFPLVLEGDKPTNISGSPADFMPANNSHLIMWYKCL